MASTPTTGEFVILCVCAGNIHRSALAEALLETWAQWYLPEEAASRVRVHSAGLIAESGMPMSERARKIATALGAQDRPRTATTLTDDLVESADIVLTATRRQADEVVRRVPTALRTTFTMREVGRVADALAARGDSARERTPEGLRAMVAAMADGRNRGNVDEDDVIDPQGRDDDAYLLMTQQEVPPLAALAAVLFGMSLPDVTAYARAVNDDAELRERMTGAAPGAQR